jgi:hypothetical protein
LSPTQEHTNTIRRFQFVSLQEAAAYVAKVRGGVARSNEHRLHLACSPKPRDDEVLLHMRASAACGLS